MVWSKVLSMDQLLTDPEQAVDFVKQTNCDAPAIAIGTSHGAYKFLDHPLAISLQLIASRRSMIVYQILISYARILRCPRLAAVINENGGEIPELMGSVEEIQEGLKHGVRRSTSTRTCVWLQPDRYELFWVRIVLNLTQGNISPSRSVQCVT